LVARSYSSSFLERQSVRNPFEVSIIRVANRGREEYTFEDDTEREGKIKTCKR
jgi:hypothetical protein